jgi:allophanate hydrolase
MPCVRTIGVLPADAPVRATMQPHAVEAYDTAVHRAVACGFVAVDVDVEPFLAAGRLLYGGAFVAERTAAVGSFLAETTDGVDPTVRGIIAGGSSRTAVDAYESEYRLADLRATTSSTWDSVDALLLPTIPGTATVDEVAREPIAINAWLGTFTTFANLLDLAAVAVPVGRRPDALPSGVQLLGPAWSDEALADAAAELLGEDLAADGVRPGEIAIVVVGAHLSGMALNWQLTARRARRVRATRTAPRYRLHALAGTVPPKPGLRRELEGGAAIEVEVWALAPSTFASFVTEVPPPLAIGSVELEDGTWCKGFVCEPGGFDGADDITAFGGWRAYMAQRPAVPSGTSS